MQNKLEGVGNPGSPHLPSVVSVDGVRWIDYRRTLVPRYSMVWRDIAGCYAALALGLAAVLVLDSRAGDAAGWAAAVPAAVWIGYWLHSLFLFGHEAAHRNLAPRRPWNDRLGDWLVWILYGSTTAEYRRTHMAHHTQLGNHRDPETTYHLCLSVINILKGLTGVHVLEVMLRNRRNARRAPGGRRQGGGTALASLRTVAVHAALLSALVLGGALPAATAWAAGTAAVFPLCALLRTVVEHRHLDAPCETDFTQVEHGPVNRLFGVGPISRTFGAAGFNRHLLHHWDPAISYTRFDEMEQFFLRTPLADRMAESRTSYPAALKQLIKEAS